jgi:hypothetical protein
MVYYTLDGITFRFFQKTVICHLDQEELGQKHQTYNGNRNHDDKRPLVVH